MGELLVGAMHAAATGVGMLWEYKILPIHHGYTSYIAPLIWGVADVYAHLFWGYIAVLSNKWLRYGVLALDILIVEFILNGVFLQLFGEYIFYYHPSDLWHLTSVQALPFYLIAGLVALRALKYSAAHPRFYTALYCAIAVVVVFLT